LSKYRFYIVNALFYLYKFKNIISSKSQLLRKFTKHTHFISFQHHFSDITFQTSKLKYTTVVPKLMM